VTLNLVTGADGFVGQHLVAELLSRGEDVVGAVLSQPPQLTTLAQAEAGRVRWDALELESAESVRQLARSHRPDRIFHLAGLSSAADSLDDPVPPMRINVVGTLFLLDELGAIRRETGHDPAILIAGSAHVYGAAAARFRPLTEDCPLEPLSPYGVSKAAQEMLGTQFHRSAGLSIIVTRSFNHLGPGQRPVFVAAELASRIVELRESGGEGTVRAGNLEVRRDFSDVRDVVRAYVALTESGEAGRVYNVCSGRAYAVGQLVDILAELAGVQVEIETDPARLRPTDVPEMVGSYERLAGATGWAPEIPLERSLADLLDWVGGR
jgi:GDP-4-dehydro-6-deoxy-D-mannose reductase